MTTHHPDANLFPMLSESELTELAADIAANGLREAIKLDYTGELLVDGRNREEGCRRAEVEPRYERLPAETDIFAYVVSINLRRRHLTDAQRRDIIREIANRNPDLSIREIARAADASAMTVSRVLRRPGVTDDTGGQRTTGGDGKNYPKSGRYTEARKQEILAQIQANRGMPERELAAKLGVSHGTIQRYRRELDGEAPYGRPKGPSIAEQLAKRAAILPRYDTMTREERGMGSREYGAEQHPDYPPGWTRDHVHREKYGRIQLFTPNEQAERELVRRFQEIIAALNRITTDPPSADDLVGINFKSREPIEFQLSKLGPKAIAAISEYLARIAPAETERAS